MFSLLVVGDGNTRKTVVKILTFSLLEAYIL